MTVAAYVLAVGWQPSVVRAGVAGGLASLAWLASRPRDRWYLLVGAAVLVSPGICTACSEPGFQLVQRRCGDLRARSANRAVARRHRSSKLAEVISLSAACGLVTAPVLWLHFSAVPCTPSSPMRWRPVVAPLLGLRSPAALQPLLPEASAALVWLDAWLAGYLAFCAAGRQPALRASESLSALALLVAASLAALLFARHAAGRSGGWSLWRASRSPSRSHGGLRPTRPFRRRPTGCGSPCSTSVRATRSSSRSLRARCWSTRGHPKRTSLGQLGKLGVDSLTALVLTHPQRDHVGGAADVLEHVEVAAVLDPLIPSPSEDEQAALSAREHGVPIVLRGLVEVSVGALRVRILWPAKAAFPADDPNDHAVVLLASYGDVDALLTADAEGDVTVPIRPPPAEILKVAHHGSSDPLLPSLLDLLHPSVAVVSAGEGNHGHPTPETMAALDGFAGLAVYRTDEDGAVTIETDGRRISVVDEG